MATTTPRMKITYATLSADNEELQSAFDSAVERVRGTLGQSYPMLIGGEERRGAEEFEDRSPIDRDIVVARFPVGTRQDVRDAIAAARAAYPAWRDLGWRQRLEILRNAADLISERQFEYAALMAFEVGKNRLEALGDVEETADLLRYYSDEMERNGGFVKPMGSLSPTEHTRSVLKPHGVWAVISPFNFPMALAGGPAAGALIAGNTVVLKPSSDAPLMGYKFGEALREAGVPAGVFNLVTGPGETVGAELQESPDIDGMVFTGSYEVGMKLYTGFTRDYPRPIITEMGGKNPAIITASADLDEAAEGVMRSAFGFDGQKCSANSRVYVERSVARPFVDKLVERAKGIKVGDPTQRDNWMGPVINERSLGKFTTAVEEAKRDGGTIEVGGEVLARPGHRARLLPQPHRGDRAAPQPPPLPRRAVRAVPGGWRGRLAGPGPGRGERHALRPDGRDLQPGRRRDPALPGHDPGRRGLREPARRRDHRRLAGDPELRRLEGLRLIRQERPRPVLRPAVPARAVADRHGRAARLT